MTNTNHETFSDECWSFTNDPIKNELVQKAMQYEYQTAPDFQTFQKNIKFQLRSLGICHSAEKAAWTTQFVQGVIMTINKGKEN